MQHTLIAVFDNHADATSAQNELLSSGFSSSDVRLQHGDETAPGGSMASSTTTTTTTTDNEPGIGESIKNFFSDLFGSDSDNYSSKYSTAASLGNHILTVNTDSEAEVERAADIVERFGPIDIDEQSEKWGMTEGSGAMMGSRGSMSGGQSMSLQSDPDRLPLNQQSLNDPVPMGTTYQEPMGSRDELSTGSYGAGTGSSLQQNQGGTSLSGSSLEGSAASSSNLQGSSLTGSQQRDTSTLGNTVGQEQRSGSMRDVQRTGVRVFSRSPAQSSLSGDDDYYRNHFTSTYGTTGDSYDDYAPAYSYGSEMARDQKYSGRKWDDVENDLSSDWATRAGNKAGSTWEKMKAAVKHGWDRMTSDDDDSYYRNHYNATYSSTAGASDYDKYQPAYRYGSEMSQSQMYRNRPWDEVEPNLRSDWETRHRDTGSTWENMKDAVRHGWNKMTK